MKPQKIAIVVGHLKDNEGAKSPHLNQTEYAFNTLVANNLKALNPGLYDLYFHKLKGYYQRQAALAQIINPLNYDLVIELHFNSFNQQAHGTECLYDAGKNINANGVDAGKYVAQELSKGIVAAYQTTLRHGGAVDLDEHENGYWFTHLPKAPAVIIEPFFGDNVEALKFQDTNKYATTLNSILSNLNI